MTARAVGPVAYIPRTTVVVVAIDSVAKKREVAHAGAGSGRAAAPTGSTITAHATDSRGATATTRSSRLIATSSNGKREQRADTYPMQN